MKNPGNEEGNEILSFIYQERDEKNLDKDIAISRVEQVTKYSSITLGIV
jgi:hypothetical protein